jgi:hypothetical protein
LALAKSTTKRRSPVEISRGSKPSAWSNSQQPSLVRSTARQRRSDPKGRDERYLKYDPKREYGLAIYTADFSGEANKFFKWNSKGSKVAAGKAYYVSSLTSPSLSALAPDHFPSLHPTLPQASLFGVSGNFMPFPGFDGGRAGLLEAKILVSAVRFRT